MTEWRHRCLACFRAWFVIGAEPDTVCPFCGAGRVKASAV